jgi:glycosyltransferase involved in cell wall biosynthesis
VREQELERQRKTHFSYEPLISIAVPAYHTPERQLREMIDSVRRQSYANWQLCIADGSGDDAAVASVLREYQKADPRIDVRILDQNLHIAGNTNAALAMAKGEFVGLLDHDDLLEPDALFEIVARMQDGAVDIVYTDEDKISWDGGYHREPNFKPDFNPDLLRSCNYITHFLVIRRAIVEKAGGFHGEYDGAQDYDLILRCTELSRNIRHVRRVLYHWRMGAHSTAEEVENKTYCLEAGKRAIEAHLARLGEQAKVNYLGREYAFYHVEYAVDDAAEKKTAVVSGQKTGKVLPDDTEYVLFLNPELSPMDENAKKELVGACARADVGAVGGMTVYADNRICHAGIAKNPETNDNFMEFWGMPHDQMGYLGRAQLNADYHAVLLDCMIVKKSIVDQIGWPSIREDSSLEERVAESVSYCEKIAAGGYRILYNAFSKWQYGDRTYRQQKRENQSFHECKGKYQGYIP